MDGREDAVMTSGTVESLLEQGLPSAEVFYLEQLVGRIAQVHDGRCAFEYDVDFLKKGISISPFQLPAEPGLVEATHTPFYGNFGVFEDSLPDGWGSLVLDLYLREQGIDPASLSVLHRLSLVGSTGRGALEYLPDASAQDESIDVDFNGLAQQVQDLYHAEKYNEESLDTLYRYSGSSGGARPKIFIAAEGEEWLVKFAASIDPTDVGKQEYGYSFLARECGLEMADTKLFEDKYFGTKRFDRTPTGKVHTISAAGLLNADYRIPSLDYEVLLKACAHLTLDMHEVEKLFKLMVFNVVIGNRDDHAKNFSFQLHGDKWKLSPVYDVLPCYGFNGNHTTTINGQGNPKRSDLIACGSAIDLGHDIMNEIIDKTLQICKSENMHRPDLKL